MYHLISSSTNLYWPSTSQYRHILTQYHQVPFIIHHLVRQSSVFLRLVAQLKLLGLVFLFPAKYISRSLVLHFLALLHFRVVRRWPPLPLPRIPRCPKVKERDRGMLGTLSLFPQCICYQFHLRHFPYLQYLQWPHSINSINNQMTHMMINDTTMMKMHRSETEGAQQIKPLRSPRWSFFENPIQFERSPASKNVDEQIHIPRMVANQDDSKSRWT